VAKTVELQKLPTSVIVAKLGLQPDGRVHKWFTNTCALHMDKYVPFSEGTLAETVVVGGTTTSNVTTDEIIYDTPYAHYMYMGEVYVDPEYGVGAFPIKDKEGNIKGFYSRKDVKKIPSGRNIIYNDSMHSEAGPYWDKRMWTAEKDEVVKEVEEYMWRNADGL